jgi:hypothetical protein
VATFLEHLFLCSDVEVLDLLICWVVKPFCLAKNSTYNEEIGDQKTNIRRVTIYLGSVDFFTAVGKAVSLSAFDLDFGCFVFFAVCGFFIVAVDVAISVSGSGEPGGV